MSAFCSNPSVAPNSDSRCVSIMFVFLERDHFVMRHLVIGKLLAIGVDAVRIVCQCLAGDHSYLFVGSEP